MVSQGGTHEKHRHRSSRPLRPRPAHGCQRRRCPIKLIAAENFYGVVAQQIGGDKVAVTSVMSNPDQDPHLFETSPSVARELTDANIVIYNGADYDAWMPKLLNVSARQDRVIIVAAELVHRKAGENPHIWYDPATMPAVAQALASAFAKIDPAHAADYKGRLAAFLASLKPVDEKINEIRKKFGGAPVTASEPVFGYMASALGLKMHNENFQIAIMNDTEPSARDVAAFQRDLKEHRVRAMFYNKQASNRIVQQLVALARASKIPVIGITETIPNGSTFQDWMLSELNETEKALSGPSS